MSAHAVLSLEALGDMLRLYEAKAQISGLSYDAETRTVRLELEGDSLEGQVALKYSYQNPMLSSTQKLNIVKV